MKVSEQNYRISLFMTTQQSYMFEDLQASLYHHTGMVSDLLQPQPFCDCVILCNILKITYKKLYLQLISTEHKIMLKIFLIVILEISNKWERLNSTLMHMSLYLGSLVKIQEQNSKSNKGTVKFSLSVFSLKLHVFLMFYFNYMASNMAF